MRRGLRRMTRLPAVRACRWAYRLATAVALTAFVTFTADARSGDVFDLAERGRPALKVLSDRDGLPQNTVHAITFDIQGRLWLGTQDGAAVSDGRGWQVVNMPSRMESNFVRAILSASDGSLWFGTQAAGLHRLVRERWEDMTPPCPHPAKPRVNALLETLTPPAIWVATHDCGVARYAGGTWEFFGRDRGLPSERVWGLHVDSGSAAAPGSLLAGTEEGLAVLSPGSSRFVPEAGFPRLSVNAFLERPTPEGIELWVGTYGGGVLRRRAGTWTPLTERDGLPSGFVTSLASHGEGGPVWVGTDGGGLAAVTERGIQIIDTSSGLPSDAIYALHATGAQRGAKTLWIGTRSGGLVRLMQGRWQSFLPAADGTSFAVTALLLDPGPGNSPVAWFGTDGGGLARLDRRGWTRYVEKPGELPSNAVQCLLATRNERGEPLLWVGTRHGGLARLANRRWVVMNQNSGALPNDMVQALAETTGTDGVPEVWVGTRGGLAVFRHGRWYGPPAGLQLPNPSVQVLLASRDASGTPAMWIGTANGLVRCSAGACSAVEAPLRNRSVQALQVVEAPGNRRELWIGSDGGGVSRLDLSPQPRELPTLTDESDPPLPNNVVYQILQDRQARVYLLTNRGVARLSWRQDGPQEFDIERFSVDDGLVSNQGNRGAGAVDWRGRIWVGTVGGASLFDPATEETDRVRKPLLLRTLSPGGRVLAMADVQRLPWWRAHLVFDYALQSHFREADTRYRTELHPVDDQPSDWNAEFRREVGPLAPGDYTFRVWGRDWAGNVTGPEGLTFEVVPPPWQTWWAVAGYVLLAAGAVAIVVSARARAHRRREEALRALIAARTRELTDANVLLSELSYLDPVTNISNRRRFDDRLDHEWRRAARAGSALSLIMIDIDFFKEFNDTFGHQRGDECLRAIATTLADGLPRAGDSVARYGGEEFAVILPLTEQAGAVKLAEALRHRVEELGISHPASSTAPVVTISCGVATVWPMPEVEREELIRLADKALYVAKHTGRNRTAAEPSTPSSSTSLGAAPPSPPV